MSPADSSDTGAVRTEAPVERRSLSLDGLPALQALVRGPHGAEILAELERLASRQAQRAPRYRRDLLARIRVGADRPPEVAVVRDISATGIRLRIPLSAQLDVVGARQVTIEMRLPGSPFVSCAAALVRVVDRRDNGVELAFSLLRSEPDPAFDAFLSQLAVPEPGGGEAGR